VRCADFRRREYSPRRVITKSFQIFDDISESEADVSFNVLEEDDSGSHGNNSICDPRPEVSWVVFSKSLACCTKWLTGIASREDVHAVTKL
jgi:hypothetical protein